MTEPLRKPDPFLDAALPFAPPPPSLQDHRTEAVAPALYELRKMRTPDLAQIRALLESTPPHLHAQLCEAASNRNVVAREVVVMLLGEVSWPRLVQGLGERIASNLAQRYLPRPLAD